MSRIAPKASVSPKMYRHFAVLTLVITAMIAFFAQGENEKALQQRLAEQKDNKELRQAEMELALQGKGGNTGLVFKDNRKSTTTWARDPSAPAPNYVNFSEIDDSVTISHATVLDGGGVPIDLDEYDVPLARPPGMSEEDYQDLLRRVREAKKAKKKPSQKEIEAMLAASRLRSGFASE